MLQKLRQKRRRIVLQGVSGQVKERVEKAAAGELDPTTRPLLLFPEVRLLTLQG